MINVGKTLVIIGIIFIVAGIIIYFSSNRLSWIGRLPGDIRIEKENFRFYFPITTTILFSLAITLILWIIRKLF